MQEPFPEGPALLFALVLPSRSEDFFLNLGIADAHGLYSQEDGRHYVRHFTAVFMQVRRRQVAPSFRPPGEEWGAMPWDLGGASRDRTDDLIVANDALSQLSYSPAPDGVLRDYFISLYQFRHNAQTNW
jgi:hypothetical protein